MTEPAERQAGEESTCRHCDGRIWWMGDYSGWVHAASWTRVCDTNTHGPVAEPKGEGDG